MPKLTKTLLWIFAVIAFLFGAPLLLAPGQFLGLFGWEPVEPLLDRLLGAALLGMAWSAWRSATTSAWDQAHFSIETFAVFCLLGAIGFLRHLVIGSYYPFMVWFVFALLLVWTLLWGWVLYKARSA